MDVEFLKRELGRILDDNDAIFDGDAVSYDVFRGMIDNPDMVSVLDRVGVDVNGLAELNDFVFRGKEALPFHDFMAVLLQLRGSQQATVKDIVEMRKFLYSQMGRLEDLIRKSNGTIM